MVLTSLPVGATMRLVPGPGHDGAAAAGPDADAHAGLVELLHRLAQRRGQRVAASRIAELVADAPLPPLGEGWDGGCSATNTDPSPGPEALLRRAAAVCRGLGWPARVVRLPLAQALRLGPTLAALPVSAGGKEEEGAMHLLQSRRDLPAALQDAPAKTEILVLDLRADPAAPRMGAWLWSAVCAESGHVVAALVALTLSQGLGLLGPAVAWLVTDRALPDGAAGLLTVAVLGLVAVAGHGAALGWWRDRVTRSLDQRLRTRANGMMFDALLRSAYAETRGRTVGEGLQLLSSAELIAGAALGSGLGPLLGLFSAAVAWATLCALVPAAAWALAGLALGLLLLSLPLARNNTRWQGEVLHARAAQQSLLLELLQGGPALRTAGAEHAGARRWLRRLVDEQTATLGQVRAGLWLDVLLEGSLQLTRAGWLAWGGAACVRGDISLGPFLASAMLAEQVMRQAIALSHALMSLTALAPHWRRVNGALQAAAAAAQCATPPQGPARAVPADPGVPALRLDHLFFRYDPRAPWAVRDHSLEVPAGALVVLSGASGAGKTTLLRLAAGLLTPQQGQVEVFGQPVQAGSDLIGYLPQEAPLFEGSIASNLRWLAGCPASQVLAVARRTGLDDWVRTLPMGYATRVSAGGGSFSGGQRQLIALTAVLASDRPLLLLDEPMSQLDRLSRRRILDSGLFQGRTMVVISHDRNGLAVQGEGEETDVEAPAAAALTRVDEAALVA